MLLQYQVISRFCNVPEYNGIRPGSINIVFDFDWIIKPKQREKPMFPLTKGSLMSKIVMTKEYYTALPAQLTNTLNGKW